MAFGDHQESLTNTGTGTAPTITLAGAPANGSLVVIYVINNTEATAIADTTGSGAAFTEEIDTDLVAFGETGRHALYWKIGASEPATYTFSGGDSLWSVHAKVFDGGAGVDAPTVNTSDGNAGVRFDALECDAINGAIIPDNALSICIAAMDNNRVSTNPYTSADNSFVHVIGEQLGRMSAMCDRFFTTGETFSGIVIMTCGADSSTDAPFSVHLSFIETGASTSDVNYHGINRGTGRGIMRGVG